MLKFLFWLQFQIQSAIGLPIGKTQCERLEIQGSADFNIARADPNPIRRVIPLKPSTYGNFGGDGKLSKTDG